MGDEVTALEAVVVGGDLAKLTPEQRLAWYRTRCEAAGLDPRAQPFQYIQLQGKLTLYATKGATDQLAANRHLCVEVLSREMTDGEIYEVVARVRDASGRVTEDMGAVFVGGLSGEALANARMKGTTKAKRRTILAHCGLGMLDETEAESIPGATQIQVSPAGELQGALPAAPTPAPHDLAYWRRRAMAAYTSAGGDTANRDACRKDIAKDLHIDAKSRTELTLEQWQAWALHLEEQLRRPAAPQAQQEDETEEQEETAQPPALDAVKSGEQGTYAEATIRNAQRAGL